MIPRIRKPLTRERLEKAVRYLGRRLFRSLRGRQGTNATVAASLWFGGLLSGHDRAAAEEERTILHGTGGVGPQGTLQAPRGRR